MRKRILLVALVLALVAGMWSHVSPVTAQDKKSIIVEWKQDISDDFGGWYFYKYAVSGGWVLKKDGGDPWLILAYEGGQQTTYTAGAVLTGPPGQESTFFFVLTSYDVNGNESDQSNEVTYTLDFLSPNQPFELIIRTGEGGE
jgi:hypothetical protein